MLTFLTPRQAGMRDSDVTAVWGSGPTAEAYAAPPGDGTGPNIGILLYDGYSLLDPTGPAEVLSRLPDATVTMIAEKRGAVRTDTGDVAVVAERSIAEVDLRLHRQHRPRRGRAAGRPGGDDLLGLRRLPPVHVRRHLPSTPATPRMPVPD
jgi:hypothetical protein